MEYLIVLARTGCMSEIKHVYESIKPSRDTLAYWESCHEGYKVVNVIQLRLD